MAFTGKEGKVISEVEAKEITAKHIASKGSVEKEGGTYIESHFFGIETIKQALAGIPVKSILGVRVKYGNSKAGNSTVVLEVVTKDETVKYRAMSDPTDCPTFCK